MAAATEMLTGTARGASASAAGVLTDVLESLRFKGTVFFRSQLAAPWGVWSENARSPRFHIALRGGFYVGMEDGGEAIHVQESDIILLPRGGVHWIADRPGRSLLSPAAVAEQCELGIPPFQDGVITNEMMCARVRFGDQLSHPLLDALPGVIHIPAEGRDSSIWRLVTMIDEEIDYNQSISGPVVERLSEVLFLQLLRQYVEQVEIPQGFIAALHDRRLRLALHLLHARNDEDWTVEALAGQVCMSRATLARRFKEATGMGPIEYLVQWRLLKAHELINHSSRSLEWIAEQVGFASAQTLARSFKRQFGYTPSSLRRQA